MAHFAELDENNTVQRVIVIHNNECLKDGNEDEEQGISFCKSLFGENTKWKQTSYNNNFRKIYAYEGCTYDEINDVFVPPCPHPTWIFDKYAHTWMPPIMYPIDGNVYIWDMETESWMEIPS